MKKATFLEKRHEAGDIYTFVFRPVEDMEWEPGQYIDYRLGFNQTKHFTIASAPYEGTLNITTRIFEKHSKFKEKLLSLKKGDKVKISSPQGQLTLDNPDKEYVLVAGGIGITPYRAILWDLAHKELHTKVTLLYIGDTGNLAFLDELKEKEKKIDSLKVKTITDRYLAREDLIDFSKKDITYLISGPPKMVGATEKILRDLKISKKKVKSDYFVGY